MKKECFILKYLDTYLAKITACIVSVFVFILSKPSIKDLIGLSDDQVAAAGAAIGFLFSSLISEYIAFRRNQYVKEIQSTINNLLPENEIIKEDGKAGPKTVSAFRNVVEEFEI